MYSLSRFRSQVSRLLLSDIDRDRVFAAPRCSSGLQCEVLCVVDGQPSGRVGLHTDGPCAA